MYATISRHARHRASQRGLTEEEMTFVHFYGRRLHRTGIMFIFLGQRDIPARFRRSHGYLTGATLLIAQDGTVITAYKNPDALRVIKKKAKTKRFSHSQIA